MKSLVALFFSTLFAVGLAEVGLRFIYPDGINQGQQVSSWPWIEYSPVVGWRNQAGFRHKSMGLYINEHNFRGPEISSTPEPGVTRIVCLGDSRTFGVWSYAEKIRTDNAYPDYLRELFDESGRRVEVINAGVIGYASSHGLRQLVTRVVDLQPDVIIASFGFNDAAASWDPSLRKIEPQSVLVRKLLYAFADYRILQLMEQAYYRIPGVAPDAWVVPWNTPEEYRNHMRGIAKAGAKGGMKVIFLNQAVRHIARGDSIIPDGSNKVPIPKMLGFDDLEDLHESYGVYQAITLEVAEEQGVALVDGVVDFALYQGDPLFGDYDLAHVNTLGAQRLAQLIHDEILALGWLDIP